MSAAKKNGATGIIIIIIKGIIINRKVISIIFSAVWLAL